MDEENEGIKKHQIEAIAGIGIFKVICQYTCVYTLILLVLFSKDPDILDAIIYAINSFGDFLRAVAK